MELEYEMSLVSEKITKFNIDQYRPAILQKRQCK